MTCCFPSAPKEYQLRKRHNMELQHTPEDICLLQQMDSLTFSMSPVAPSTSSNTREDEGDNISSTHSCNKSNDEDDEENPLMGEYIWDEDNGDGYTNHGNSCRQLFRDVYINGGQSPDHMSPSPRPERGLVEANENMDMSEGDKQPPYMIKCRGLHQGEGIENMRMTVIPGRVHKDSKYDEKVVPDGDLTKQVIVPPIEEGTEQRGQNDEENIWADNGRDNFTPVWDERTPAWMLRDNITDEGESASETCEGNRPRRRVSRPREASEFQCHDESLDDRIRRHEDEEWYLGQTEYIPHTIHRRTRLSLDQERRRLDRLPRSQRLRQVKGHPLGGMTLLELEDRHLLDVGIGKIAKRLASMRGGGVRQMDTDLLRRSARLFRRAQQERDARYALKFEQESIKTPLHGCGAFGINTRATSARKGSRRPASASREHYKPASYSFSLDSAEQNRLASANTSKPGRTDKRVYPTDGAPANVGLYSGGGDRCSLKQRRPMSAKPALTCGSGWKPGRSRDCRRDGEKSYFGESRRRHLQEAGYIGQGKLDVVSIGSDLSDLSSHDIVEYTDEEESPFNVDELERVAALYLLNPRGSVCRSSPGLEDDETYADDGSVYIYKEGDFSDQQDREVHDNGFSGGYYVDRHPHDINIRQSDAEHDVYRWHDVQRGDNIASTRLKKNETRPQRRDNNPDESHRILVQEGDESSGTVQSQENDGNDCNGRGEEHVNATYTRSANGPTHQGGDVAAGTCRSDKVGISQQRPPLYSDGRGPIQADRELCNFPGISQALPEGHNPRINIDSNVQFDGSGTSRTNYCLNDSPPEEVVPVIGASYSPKVRRGLRGTGYGKGLSNAQDESAVDSSAKISQVAIRLRDMILERQASAGRSIRQIFRHFDRRGCGYVKATDLGAALTDLRLKISPSEAEDLHKIITLDGGDRFSYGEFSVFVSDPYHLEELQAKVCRQAAARLEIVGRQSVNLHAAFLPGSLRSDTLPDTMISNDRPARAKINDSRLEQGALAKKMEEYHGGYGERQVVSAEDFMVGLKMLGLDLSQSDVKRLFVRFDVHGDGCLSVVRFASMVENSSAWRCAMTRLTRQAEADEEADALLRSHRMTGRWPAGQTLSEEIIEMARYIGIRVSSDASLLWIAADALEAPLPDGWVISQRQDGRCLYRNRLTGQSRWDHPMDPHFRRRYLRERFGSAHADAELSLEARNTLDEPKDFKIGVGTDHPPVILPPRQMRPDLRDFSANKALENLRVRRLNASGDIRSQVAGGLTVTTNVSERQSMARTNINPAWNSMENRAGKGDVISNPLGGSTRRRPVSASALRKCLNAKSQTRSGGDDTHCFGFGTAKMAAELYTSSSLDLDSLGNISKVRSRRPRSARATLQRSAVDDQMYTEHRGVLHNSQLKMREPWYEHDSERLHPSLPNRVDERWMVQDFIDGEKGREPVKASLHDTQGGGGLFVHEANKYRENSAGFATNRRSLSSEQEEIEGEKKAGEEEQMWLLDRLADLGKAKKPSKGGDDQRRAGSSCASRAMSYANGIDCVSRLHSFAFGERGGDTSSSILERAENNFQENTVRPCSGTSELREQVVKMDSRLRGLETRLQGPPRPRDGFHRPRPQQFSDEMGASLSTAEATHTYFPQNVSTSSRVVCTKNTSQDDLMSEMFYHPVTGTGHESGAVASCTDSCGSSRNDFLVSVVEDGVSPPRNRRWRDVARKNTGSGRIRRRSIGAGRGRREGQDRGIKKRGSGNRCSGEGAFSSPGIVLI